MATPQGKLLVSGNQTNTEAQMHLVIFIISTVAVVAIVMLAHADAISMILAIIPFALALLTLPKVLRDSVDISVFEDGIAFYRFSDRRLIAEATWSEVPNIRWEVIQRSVGAFGVLGLTGTAGETARQASDTSTTPKANAYLIPIVVNGKTKRFVIDRTCNQFSAIEAELLRCSTAAWHDEALAALKAGKRIRSGTIALTPEIVTNGQQHAEWDQITAVEITDPDRARLVVRYQDAGKGRRFFISNWQRGVALGSVILDYRKIAHK